MIVGSTCFCEISPFFPGDITLSNLRNFVPELLIPNNKYCVCIVEKHVPTPLALNCGKSRTLLSAQTSSVTESVSTLNQVLHSIFLI